MERVGQQNTHTIHRVIEGDCEQYDVCRACRGRPILFDTIISMYQMLLHTRLGLLLDAAARRPLPAPRPPPRPRAKPRLSLRARSSSSSLPWRALALARLPCPSRVCPLLPSRPTRARLKTSDTLAPSFLSPWPGNTQCSYKSLQSPSIAITSPLKRAIA